MLNIIILIIEFIFTIDIVLIAKIVFIKDTLIIFRDIIIVLIAGFVSTKVLFIVSIIIKTN